MKRLFTFGCSFTKWRWPTWADILAKNKSYDLYENWGESGSGNPFIFNSIIECDLRHKFTKDDTICVMWSTTHRVDVYNNHRWKLRGGIVEQADDLNDERGYYIRDMALIEAIYRIISPLKCDFQMMSMVNLNNHLLSTRGASGKVITSNSYKSECNDVSELYSELLNKIHPSVHEVVYNYDWRSIPLHSKGDMHPGPLLHLEYLDKIFGNDYISSDTRRIVEEWNKLYHPPWYCNDPVPADWAAANSHTPVRF